MNKTTFIPVYKRKLDSEHWPRSEKYDQKSLNGRSGFDEATDSVLTQTESDVLVPVGPRFS